MNSNTQIDLEKHHRAISLVPPPYASSWDYHFNIDGHINFSRRRDTAQCRSYLQVFRSGIIEGVNASLLHDENKTIPSGIFEKKIIEAVKQILDVLDRIEVEPPIFIMISLLAVRGYVMYVGPQYDTDHAHPYEQEVMILPDLMVETAKPDLPALLRPIFNVLWQAFGWSGSLNYDQEGKWAPR